MTVSPGPDVLDVGCGTGIAARLFQAAGGRVLGVDPDDRVATLARRSGVPAEVATFETWDPAGRRFDAVIAAQAWHWVDPVAGAAQAAQALRPNGYAQLCAKAADGMRQAGGFGEPEQWRFDWERRYTRDEWLDQVPTFGGLGQRMPPAMLNELLTGIGAIIDTRMGGSFTMGYATVAVSAARS